MPSASSIWQAYASINAFITLIRTIVYQLVPDSVQQYFLNAIRCYFQPANKNATYSFDDCDDMSINEVYSDIETYLTTKINPDIRRLKIFKRPNDTDFTMRLEHDETLPDLYCGVKLKWRFVHKERKESNDSRRRYFELHFENKHAEMVRNSYIPHIRDTAKSILLERQVRKLHTLAPSSPYRSSVAWNPINLDHRMTFEKLAMEPEEKKRIIVDLDRFLRRKDHYRKVGRAWKRGYLLHGPPGTGKTSLIAAMANYLKFDIYDLQLSSVRSDSHLRELLLRTANRSILAIEDIDCTVDLPDRNGPKGRCSDSETPGNTHQGITLSGLLNFIDGLWSSCGDERIIVFTTNNKEKLDPALLRAGRMDMHIPMSYLTVAGFKQLISTYLNVEDNHHRLFPKIHNLIEVMKVTPSQVAEELWQGDDMDASLKGLLKCLEDKKKKKKEEEEEEEEEEDKKKEKKKKKKEEKDKKKKKRKKKNKKKEEEEEEE